MKKARIGLVGTGWWACFIQIPTIQAMEQAEIVAICNRGAEKLKRAGDEFNIQARYHDVNDMLKNESLDGVMVSTAHTAHIDPSLAALEAGCHLLVEKPMATNAKDGWAIYHAGQKAGKEVMVPTGMNFKQYTIQAAQWVREGHIGEVKHAICQMGSALEDLFAGEPMLETKTHLFRPPASTWADPQQAGGYGWGQMSHSLSWLTYVADIQFDSIYCMDVKSKAGVDYYDAAIGRATNGATIVLSGASTVPKHRGMHTDIRIYGTKGMIVFDNERARLAMYGNDGTDELYNITQQDADYDGALPVKIFGQLCAGENIVNASNGECGARVTEALHGLYQSAKIGGLVKIGELQ